MHHNTDTIISTITAQATFICIFGKYIFFSTAITKYKGKFNKKTGNDILAKKSLNLKESNRLTNACSVITTIDGNKTNAKSSTTLPTAKNSLLPNIIASTI